VAVIGRRAHRVPAERALEQVAGYAVGQDVSERILQLAAAPPQFSMGLGRDPQRWLSDGDVLTSHIEGIGGMRHRFVAASPVRKEN
jgi:2-keto-4-pentenoate hydratase/2-oxohepta-3-ene-1,7-dioic acid hydratase in catechol pathway